MAPPGHSSRLSLFEELISKHSPVLELLLLHLPTSSLLHLYHTSRFLQVLLQAYAGAWKHLSFRVTQDRLATLDRLQATAQAGLDGTRVVPRESKTYALDQLLFTIVGPLGSQLRTIDLDDTVVSGFALTTTVLSTHKDTLQHVSVRGCKNVSLKYHILPFLHLQRNLSSPKPLAAHNDVNKISGLALRSLYVFRCRHHRRRPYVGTSLSKKDAEPEATHELVNLCHELGIWTDTAWCTTPGHRCVRRKDYHTSHAGPGGKEIWVVFDRLWRCGNRLGSSIKSGKVPEVALNEGRLWEEDEFGYDGEQLGSGIGLDEGEGKQLPAHLRRSHTTFVKNVTCFKCGEDIPERCEQCSVYMHCLGCRKTLCASCAFDRPSPVYMSRATAAEWNQTENFWWAPLARVSPNHTNEGVNEGAITTYVDVTLKFKWCCVCPVLVATHSVLQDGQTTLGRCKGRLRTAPLPRGRGYEDYYFQSVQQDTRRDNHSEAILGSYKSSQLFSTASNLLLYYEPHEPNPMRSTCPRNLCEECYDSKGWKVDCSTCGKPICRDHSARSLNLNVCGYPKLTTSWFQSRSRLGLAERVAFQGLPLNQGELAVRIPHPQGSGNRWGGGMPLQLASISQETARSAPLPTSEGSPSVTGPNSQENLKPDPVWKGCGAYVCLNSCWGKGSNCGVCGLYRCMVCTLRLSLC